jgi:hypothetical protein
MISHARFALNVFVIKADLPMPTGLLKRPTDQTSSKLAVLRHPYLQILFCERLFQPVAEERIDHKHNHHQFQTSDLQMHPYTSCRYSTSPSRRR